MILVRLALDEAGHVRDILVGNIPFAENLISDAGKHVVRVFQWDLRFVRGGTDL